MSSSNHLHRRSSRAHMNILTLLILTSTALFTSQQHSSVEAFGARRQYHSYHHLSQSKGQLRSSYNKQRPFHGGVYNSNDSTSNSNRNRDRGSRQHIRSNHDRSQSSPLSSSFEEEEETIEMLLEKAEKIRALAAHRQFLRERESSTSSSSST